MKYKISLITLLLVTTCACSRSAYDDLVGNGRDEHGCLTSAGYQWSYAKNDCVRPWEAGNRFESANNTLFLIFSEDSTYAEIFAPKQKNILCKRIKNRNVWEPSKGKERVSISNDVINIYYDHYNYTKSAK